MTNHLPLSPRRPFRSMFDVRCSMFNVLSFARRPHSPTRALTHAPTLLTLLTLLTAAFPARADFKLSGTIIGTSGSWNNAGNTKEKAMDGSLSTFFDAPDASGDWVGLDLGMNVAKVVSQVRYCPRSGNASRMVGGRFQGANGADFS